MNWTGTISAISLGILTAYVGNTIYRDYIPVTAWFEVRRVTVSDTVVGKDPTLIVDRTVKHPFYGEWIVAVRKLMPDGFVTICYGTGAGTYRIDVIVPQPYSLERWAGKKCLLGEGQYRVDTRWVIEAPGYPPKEFTNISNLFKVEELK